MSDETNLSQAVLQFRAHAQRTFNVFAERMGERRRPTWYAVNALQEFVDFVRLFTLDVKHSGDAREGVVGELRALHEGARGATFDLVPADGPIARLALFMHENGDRILAALSAPAGQEAWEKLAALTQCADTVKFLPPNDEANDTSEQTGVDCNGEWTGWKDMRFLAATHRDALDAAHAAYLSKQEQTP